MARILNILKCRDIRSAILLLFLHYICHFVIHVSARILNDKDMWSIESCHFAIDILILPRIVTVAFLLTFCFGANFKFQSGYICHFVIDPSFLVRIIEILHFVIDVVARIFDFKEYHLSFCY